ncbi:N-acyl homoserine lactonase family protein [Lysobacter enzymogenes]|uniref:N-acyl homoserine lactonase family protein n=1 Tax=Lysobacter enzymogenes TaxID=69 RepID=UPI000899AB32|nr:N-acyl homoserine lactonase family protein [Lysobacter enzymogenes]SDX73993.1 Glyoxylase, beta-lactamase superfamily II [Lysobacter enzymogenes]
MSALRTALLLLAALIALPARAEPPVDALRLYVFDCGRVVFDDLGPFADTGEYDGTPGELSAPCFLIRHPKGDLLWDAGLGDRIAATPGGVEVRPGVRAFVAHTLQSQLTAVGLRADEVDYLAFSHFHWDHTGNAGAFPGATWLLSRREVQALDGQPAPTSVTVDNLAARALAKVELIDLDRDVFGDGSVRILRANGHTAGHQVLMLRLAKAGTVILSGDLFHTRENFQHGRMPAFNYSRGETLGAIDRVRRILDNTRGRLVIQHDRRDIDALPKAPAYLD